ncbi:exported hypothetical protein [Capnocytophaga canimorsus]|uniref:Alpha-L-fucosidase n=1 Tax=Capnocytophaga canimorsus TaxID=28188 RepID=A0A0B7I879_9FLAO|nr:hypothetical protein [Capnocytophaga canimorsus]CEN48161.1 exported hypothetical protein [Capnocytophaga canimorsus]
MMKLFTKQSKKILFLLLFVGALGYAQQKKVHNTIKIEENDSKEVIIEKASRVVPNQNQWEALSNEYIAFVHFGPKHLYPYGMG